MDVLKSTARLIPGRSVLALDQRGHDPAAGAKTRGFTEE